MLKFINRFNPFSSKKEAAVTGVTGTALGAGLATTAYTGLVSTSVLLPGALTATTVALPAIGLGVGVTTLGVVGYKSFSKLYDYVDEIMESNSEREQDEIQEQEIKAGGEAEKMDVDETPEPKETNQTESIDDLKNSFDELTQEMEIDNAGVDNKHKKENRVLKDQNLTQADKTKAAEKRIATSVLADLQVNADESYSNNLLGEARRDLVKNLPKPEGRKETEMADTKAKFAAQQEKDRIERLKLAAKLDELEELEETANNTEAFADTVEKNNARIAARIARENAELLEAANKDIEANRRINGDNKETKEKTEELLFTAPRAKQPTTTERPRNDQNARKGVKEGLTNKEKRMIRLEKQLKWTVHSKPKINQS